MNIIKAKVYYIANTGEGLATTAEVSGDTVIGTTKEDDILSLKELQNYNVEDMDFIELDFGTLATTFKNVKSYSVNLKTKQLDIIYFTQEELTVVQQQNQQVKDLNSRVSDISTYLSSSDLTTIADIENSILEIEKNKIINGGV
jgi:hypothetical protein